MSEKILFVDDEDYILEIAQTLFAKKGIKILVAKNAVDALALVGNNEIAVLVSDNQMPGMKGIDLLSQVKTISPDTVKILMTGYADLTTAIDAINKSEVFRFIVKPWNNKQLVDIIGDARKRYTLIKSLKKGDEAAMLSIVHALELKDASTRGHSERVAKYALLIAREMGFDADTKRAIKFGSWLHDCGKIGVSESILHHNGPLDDADIHMVRNHPLWGAEVARQARLPDVVVRIILSHHERYDGKGYPAGLKGEDIPVEARVVGIADIFDALTTERPYRKSCDIEEALDILSSIKGSVLDPVLVDLFLNIIRNYDTIAVSRQNAD
ncbi:MAG: response regulator [Deltaproteobacteria bacterium]|nr:response regulator [Deltaproteobacteria bacterium]